MAASRKWLFKNKLRARAFGWRGSKLAISRLKEAASEIRSIAKSDPVTAGEGPVSLMERIWPAFQDTAAQRIGATGWARQELFRLGQEPCSPGRELFLETVRAALFRHDGISSPG